MRRARSRTDRSERRVSLSASNRADRWKGHTSSPGCQLRARKSYSALTFRRMPLPSMPCDNYEAVSACSAGLEMNRVGPTVRRPPAVASSVPTPP